MQKMMSVTLVSYLSTYDRCLMCAEIQECPSRTSDYSNRSFTRFLFVTGNTFVCEVRLRVCLIVFLYSLFP